MEYLYTSICHALWLLILWVMYKQPIFGGQTLDRTSFMVILISSAIYMIYYHGKYWVEEIQSNHNSNVYSMTLFDGAPHCLQKTRTIKSYNMPFHPSNTVIHSKIYFSGDRRSIDMAEVVNEIVDEKGEVIQAQAPVSTNSSTAPLINLDQTCTLTYNAMKQTCSLQLVEGGNNAVLTLRDIPVQQWNDVIIEIQDGTCRFTINQDTAVFAGDSLLFPTRRTMNIGNCNAPYSFVKDFTITCSPKKMS